MMKEDEMARLEAGNIGRERKIKVQRKEKGEIRGECGEHWRKETESRWGGRKKRENG